MKNILLILALLTIFSANAFSQFDDVLKEVKKKVATNVELFEDKNITTSIDDAFPISFWLKDLNTDFEPLETDDYSFNLAPGYYRFTVQSYCLKAGTHGPTKGSGYLLAPLKGKRADLVYNVVSRSVQHPEVAQHDIQVFLWGVIYGAKFTDYDLAFQNRIRPLLTPTEIADLTVDIKNIPLDEMPDEVKSVAQYYKDLRGKITNPNIVYQDLENATMLGGYLPDAPFSKMVEKGQWAYIGNGFYARSLPESYPTSIIEIYRPAYVNVFRDAKSRIYAMELDGSRIDIDYYDESGTDVIKFNDKTYPIWRFKNIKLTGKNPGEELNIENAGWMVRGNGEPLKNSGGSEKVFSILGDPDYGEYADRVNRAKRTLTDFDEYQKQKDMQQLKDKQAEYWADYHTANGLKAAFNPLDKKGQMSWIEKHLKIVQDWWNNASSALGGEENTTNAKKKADMSKTPAVPATNGNQRLLPSERRQLKNF